MLMQQKLPPLNWFRVFEAAARHLSFTFAADELGLTQSAVSQQIKSLEVKLGTPLFIRRPRALALTDAGRQLLPQVEKSLEGLQSAAAQLGAFSGGDKTLRVAASVSLLQWVITPNLPQFYAAHGDMRIRFLSTIWPDDHINALADVTVGFGSARSFGAGAQALGAHELVAVKAPHIRGDLSDLPLIETVGASDGWARFAALAGIRLPAPKLHVDFYGMALHMVTQGLGAALVSRVLARDGLASGALTLAHDATIPAREGYYMRVTPHDEQAAAFADWLQHRFVNPSTNGP